MGHIYDIDFHFPPILKKLKRGPQIILPKDLGIIAAFSGMNRDSIVIDAGTGSGYAAIFFATIAKKVITYEIREDFVNLAKSNIARSGLKNIILRQKDIFEGIKEKADIIILDLPNPEKIFKAKFRLRSDDSCIVVYLPNIEQVKTFVSVAEHAGFEAFVVRCFIEDLLVREIGTRPKNIGLTHTAYLIFARNKSNN
jgi:tRNA (adenine57-N1/adenine58-N1)-methyltransferase